MKFARSPILSQRLPFGRARLVLGLLLAGFGALVCRTLYLQLFQNDFLQRKGEAKYEKVLDIPAMRGRVFDRHGDVLAESAPVKAVWAIPEDVDLSPTQARQLARLLQMDVRELERKLAADKGFVYVKRQVAPDVADQVAAMHLSGIQFTDEYRRYYPAGEMMAHMVGFTGIDEAGQEGVELAMNDALTGKDGSRRVVKDRYGRVVEDVGSIHKPSDGKDVTLALDDKIQYLAYSQLQRAMREHRAKAGGVVVLDAKTGEVLALVNAPTYNPNNRDKLAGAQLRNRAFTDTFEPGSTMKPFTAAMVLERGKFHPDTLIDTGPGYLKIGPATIHDAHPCGTISVSQVIQKSSNVGAAIMARSLKPVEMWQTFQQLGFGSPLKLGFPGEVGGRLRPPDTWRPIEQATMAYGSGISVTLMQLARAYLVFARDGDLIPVTLTRADGPPLTDINVFSAETAHEVRAMLETVVQPGGTAPKAQIPGYRVAGKTGTERKLEGGAYVRKYVASFVGFAPASDPRLIVAVMIDEPAGDQYYGGEVAAPVFAQVMEGALRTLGVPQDMPLRPLQMAGAVKENM
jgi:cell division protein FtsI (penicillin-binding protein 3)